MKTILLIRDHSAEGDPVLTFALFLATRMEASLILAQTKVITAVRKEKVLTGSCNSLTPAACGDTGAALLKIIDISLMDTPALAQWINGEGIGLVLRSATVAPGRLNLDALAVRVHCPLLLLPGNWLPKDFRSISYLADLRYCRRDILHWLAGFAAGCAAELSVTQLTKPGLVHIEENYAHRLFEEQICPQFRHGQLGFYYTRENDVAKAADVLINVLHHDLLVVTRNRYHHKGLPPDLQVPLLIFPG